MHARSVKAVLGVLLVAALLLTIGALSPGILAEKSKVQPHQLTILFTGDDQGAVKNCG